LPGFSFRRYHPSRTNLRFDPNPEKAASNLTKHGVSFDEAATTFADTNAAG